MSARGAVAGAGTPRRARLGRYGLHQLRDFATERGVGILLVLALFGYIGYTTTMGPAAHEALALGGDEARDVGVRIVGMVLAQSWIFLSLVAVNGLVSTDRATGRYRLLFAKPVRVERFYGQAFLLGGGALLVAVAMAAAVIMLLTAADVARLAGMLAVVAAGYLCVGGICFLASTIWRLDWLATGVVLAGSLILRARFPDAAWLALLPPTTAVDGQLGRLIVRAPLEAGPLLHVAAYGLLCVAAGLLVLRRRPLAT